jgi:hypothetical protein
MEDDSAPGGHGDDSAEQGERPKLWDVDTEEPAPPRVLRSVSYDPKGARRWALTCGISSLSAA